MIRREAGRPRKFPVWAVLAEGDCAEKPADAGQYHQVVQADQWLVGARKARHDRVGCFIEAATLIAPADRSFRVTTQTTLPPTLDQVTARPASGTVTSPVRKLPLPESVSGMRVRWPYAISIGVGHLLLGLAFVPWLFSWTGVALAVLGCYVFGTLGVNLGFHRLLTHRSFKCARWVERAVAILGVCCLQEGPARWVAIHRKHHQQSDEQPDPHSPLVAFLWGHVGWLIIENRETDSFHLLQRYSRDLMSQKFYMKLERDLRWFWVYVAHVFVIAGIALGAGWLLNHTWMGAVQFMLSIVVWGVIVRTVLVWHITWSVNSLSHLWGYQTFKTTGENSRNNWFVALISNGEGWHNNHHGDQRSAAHGHKWYELDVTYLTILAMAAVGLAKDVVRHDRHHDHEPVTE